MPWMCKLNNPEPYLVCQARIPQDVISLSLNHLRQLGCALQSKAYQLFILFCFVFFNLPVLSYLPCPVLSFPLKPQYGLWPKPLAGSWLLPPDVLEFSHVALNGVPCLLSLGLVSIINFVFLSLSSVSPCDWPPHKRTQNSSSRLTSPTLLLTTLLTFSPLSSYTELQAIS